MNVSVPKLWTYSDEKSACGSGAAKKVPCDVYIVLHDILNTVASKVPGARAVEVWAYIPAVGPLPWHVVVFAVFDRLLHGDIPCGILACDWLTNQNFVV